jgi:tetratricopeptide (TPR) repeat protein
MIKKYLKNFYERIALNRMAEGKTRKALFWYRKVEDIDSQSQSVLHNIAVLLIALKSYEEAEKYLYKEMELYGESPVIFRVLGDLYYMSGDRKLAAQYYGKALSWAEENHSMEVNFLQTRLKICKNEKLYSNAYDSLNLYEEAVDLLKEKEYDRAQELFIQVSELDRSNFMALNEAGTILLNHRKDYFNALRCFKKTYELLPLPVIKANISLAENFLKGVTK